MSRTPAEDPLMTISQVAKYLHLGEGTVLKLANEKKLPGVQLGKAWRFKRDHIEDWLETQAQDEQDFQAIPDGMQLPLGDLLPDEAIIHDMSATSPMSAIEELAGRAWSNHWLLDKQWMVSALVEREGLSSTAMEGGVAFLHTRRRDVAQLQRPFVIVGRSYNGIDFGAPDGRPTFLFFLLGLKYDKLHLPILGRLARIMASTKTVGKMRATTSPHKMRAWLLRLDAQALSSKGLPAPFKAATTSKPILDRDLRLRTIMRLQKRRQYVERKAEEAEQAKAKRATARAAKKAEIDGTPRKTAKKAAAKPATKKVAAKTTSAKKPAAKKPATKKPAAKKKPAVKSATTKAKKPAKK